MHSFFEKLRSSTFRAFAAFSLTVLLISAGCSGQNESSVSEETGIPPSLRAGQSVAQTIQLTKEQAQNLDIQTYTVSDKALTFTIAAPGQVFAAPEGISVVSAPIEGRVSKIYAHEGERVSKGDPLLDIESLEFANLVAAYLEASAEITYQQQQVERLKVLTEDKISPMRTLERAEADLRLAQTRRNASLARLKAVGITSQVIHTWDADASEAHAQLTIYAPINGVMNEHLIDLGESVHAYQKLLDIIDNTEVLVRGFVSPEDAVFIESGTPVTISEQAGGKESSTHSISATVTTMNPALDRNNKSVVLNTIVNTQQNWPLVGQSVRLNYEAQPKGETISIPLSAVQYEQADATVFVQLSELEYEKRVVSITRMTADRALLNSGLKSGEKIAVSQVFSLKALERFEQFAD